MTFESNPNKRNKAYDNSLNACEFEFNDTFASIDHLPPINPILTMTDSTFMITIFQGCLERRMHDATCIEL